jgi:hypothetical protein
MSKSRKSQGVPKDDITIPLRLPAYEALALAYLLKHLEYETVVRHSRGCVYGRREDRDVMWSALQLTRRQLADAGFVPR